MTTASETATRDARPEARRVAVPAATAAIGATVFVLAYDRGTYAPSSRSAVAIAAWWLLFLGLGLGLVRLPRIPTPAVVCAAVLAGLAGLALLSATWGPSAERALGEANRVTLYLGVFALVVLASRWLPAARWTDATAVAVAAIVVVALVSRFFPGTFGDRSLPELLPEAQGRLSFPVGYWNGLAMLAALAVPLLLRIAVADRRAVMRGAAVAPVPAIVAVAYLASSRGGVATLVVGTLAFAALTTRRWASLAAAAAGGAGALAALLVLLQRDELVNGPLTAPEVAGQGRSAALLVALACIGAGALHGLVTAAVPRGLRVRPAVGWTVAGVLAVLLVAGVSAARPVERFEAFREPPDIAFASRPDFVSAHFLSGGGSGRWQLWEAAIDQFAESRALQGGGAGSYEPWWAQHGTITAFVRDAHSLYLETLAELGLPGLALVLALVGIGVATGVARRQRAPGGDEALAAATAVVAAWAFAVGIEWMWELTVVSLVGMAMLALVTGPATAAAPEGGGRSTLALTAATVTAALAAIAGHGVSLLGQTQLEESQGAAARGDLVAAVRHAEDARRIQPWAASPYLQLALVKDQAGALGDARRSIAEAIERDPLDWRLWLARARIETEAGDIAAGRRSLLRARALNPRSPLFGDLS